MTKKLRVVLDLDETLVTTPSMMSVSEDLPAFFLAKGAILEVGGTPHYVFPGVKEFLQHLFINLFEHVEVFFFSAGDKARNEELVAKLLAYALGDSAYGGFDPEQRIFSRAHMTKITQKEAYIQYTHFLIPWASSRKKKDLNVLGTYEMPADLGATLLIDNGLWNARLGQHKNILCPPTTTLVDYQRLARGQVEENFKTNPNYRAVNGIYYSAGLFLSCFKLYQKKGFEDFLFYSQFKACTPHTFMPNLDKAHTKAFYYNSGLEWLRQYNSALVFTTASSILAACKPSKSIQGEPLQDDGVRIELPRREAFFQPLAEASELPEERPSQGIRVGCFGWLCT